MEAGRELLSRRLYFRVDLALPIMPIIQIMQLPEMLPIPQINPYRHRPFDTLDTRSASLT